MTKISEQKRTILLDFKNERLTIKGDYAPCSVTIYVIRHRFNNITYSLHLTKKSAESICEYYKKENNNEDFYIAERTLFV